MSRLASYIVLCFDLGSDGAVINRSSYRCLTVTEACYEGAWACMNRNGVIVLRLESIANDRRARTMDVIGAYGAAQNAAVRREALDEFSIEQWPDVAQSRRASRSAAR